MSHSIDHPKKGGKASRPANLRLLLIGIAGAAVTIGSYFRSPVIAVAAMLLTLVGLVLVWLLSGLSSKGAKDPAARVFIWASVAAFVIGISVLANLAVWRQPSFLADLLLPPLSQPPSETETMLIRAIYASGVVVDKSKSHLEIYGDQKLARAFIDTYSADFCKIVTDPDVRSKMLCVSVQVVAGGGGGGGLERRPND